MTLRKDGDFSKAKRGAVVSHRRKIRITILIDNDILEEFRERADAAGRGYQTLINEVLRDNLGKSRKPLDAGTLRQILRQELKHVR